MQSTAFSNNKRHGEICRSWASEPLSDKQVDRHVIIPHRAIGPAQKVVLLQAISTVAVTDPMRSYKETSKTLFFNIAIILRPSQQLCWIHFPMLRMTHENHMLTLLSNQIPVSVRNSLPVNSLG